MQNTETSDVTAISFTVIYMCGRAAWNWWLFETFVSGALQKLNIQFHFTLWFWLVFYSCNRCWWRMQYMHKYVVNVCVHGCECIERVRLFELYCISLDIVIQFFIIFAAVAVSFFLLLLVLFFTHIYYGTTIRKQINILFKGKRQCKQHNREKKQQARVAST